ncbi:MAG TPA: Ig-like domain-containing protein, partial [Verrucomicrobiae bacterium]|nr:Ig-like domain-containing protein [Verrucomicrobiae bacterium]
ANSQNLHTRRDTAVAITLTGTDLENTPLAFTVTASPGHGTLSGTAPNLTYQPAAGYIGPDSFNFSVFDGNTWSASGTVSISVTACAPPPTPLLRSTGITLSARDVRGKRATLVGVVTVKNQFGRTIPRATVRVRWMLPSGLTVEQTGSTSSRGTASFNTKSELGTATLTIISISKRNYTFDPGNIVRAQSITTAR